MTENSKELEKQIIEIDVNTNHFFEQTRKEKEALNEELKEAQDEIEQLKQKVVDSKPKATGSVPLNTTAGGVPINQNNETKGRGFETYEDMTNFLREDAKVNPESKRAYDVLLTRTINEGMPKIAYELSGDLSDPNTRFVPKRNRKSSQEEDEELMS